MHLKRVEVENFKSFGRRLAVPFLQGFTAITGPNGSGKSNIGDAVLFVLGPTSNKAIRAGRLTDLIFNGGKDRTASKECRVSLVFANEDRVIPVDEEEVTLTRVVRLSRSNAENYYSHFYVNGRPSSLTEFDTLLARSRISADGYNIVRQGDVTRIVEMTALERRRVIDGIAGITKFDSDLKAAEDEKTKVQANLERLHIILDEIERHLGTLEREREAALKHKAVKDDLDVARAKSARRRVENLRAELASLHEAAAKHDRDRATLEGERDRVRAEIAEAEEKLTGIDRTIAERGGAEAEEMRRRIDDLKATSVRAKELVNYAKGEATELKRERTSLEGDLKRVVKDLQKAEKLRDEASAAQTAAEASLVSRTAVLDALRDRIAKGTGSAAELQRELAQMKVEHERLHGELHAVRLEADRQREAVQRLETRRAELTEQIGTVEFEIRDVDWEASELRKETGVTTQSSESLEKRLFAAKKREAKLTEDLRDLENAIRRLQNEYSLLKAEQKADEKASRGYTRAVEAVTEARNQGTLKGVHGTIAELARVQSKHELAMEIAAGGRMQAIVVESDEDAARAIDFLKKNKLGRATFLPLNKMAPGRPAGKPLMAVRDADAEGFAVDLLQYDKKYAAAFWYVFRDTVVVKSLGAARRLMGGVRLVTLEGDLIDAAGAMTGGEAPQKGNMRFGAKGAEAVEKIAGQLREAIEQQEAAAADLAAAKEDIRKTEEDLRASTSTTGEKARRLLDLEKKRKEFEGRLKSVQEQKAGADAEHSGAGAAVDAAVGRAAEIETRVRRIEADRDDKGKLLLKATAKETAAELERLIREVETLRESARDLASQSQTRSKEAELLAERKAELDARVATNEGRAAEHDKNRKGGETQIEAADRELGILLKMEAEASDELRGLHAQRDKAVQARAQFETKASQITDKLDTVVFMADAARGKVPGAEEALADAEAQLAAMPVQPPATYDETLQELQATVRRLESALERLGPVNMLALEEYDRQSERQKQVRVETEHLEAERTKLDGLVAEVTARKKEGFFRVFHEINKNFASVFGRLSDGGKAELLLEDEADPFTGGLLMRSQPKGKKVTRLEALSGGEKSLTSMAFIFAIQEYEPSPFYYLDEVDQNLDGINSELLARMVREESKHAQFIVVSLRKVTLKEADNIYGVTMTSTGISEVLGKVSISEIVDEPPRAADAAHAPTIRIPEAGRR